MDTIDPYAMQPMNLLESFTLPADHPLRLAEREKAETWRVDVTRREIGYLALHSTVERSDVPLPLDIPDAA